MKPQTTTAVNGYEIIFKECTTIYRKQWNKIAGKKYKSDILRKQIQGQKKNRSKNCNMAYFKYTKLIKRQNKAVRVVIIFNLSYVN